MPVLPDIPAAVTGSLARLTPAVLQAGECLGLYRAELARVLEHMHTLTDLRPCR